MIRDALASDLPAICDIYNDAIALRMSTADLEPVSVEQRGGWYVAHTPERRPLWVFELDGAVAAWFSFRDFDGRQRTAYDPTAEVGVYVGPGHRRQGLGSTLVGRAIAASPSLGITTLLATVFAHNAPSLALFERAGFQRWGLLPAVADLAGHPADLAILGRKV